MNPGIGDLMQSPTTWDQTDWTIALIAGFALWVSFSAFRGAYKRLK